jgi:hypothetical protein
MAIATRTADAYERLRAAALGGEPVAGPDLATVRRHGLAGWLARLTLQPVVEPVRARPEPMPAAIDPMPIADELTRLIADIVVALAMETAHA